MGAAMFGGETIGQRLTATRGRTTGFDYLRAGLSPPPGFAPPMIPSWRATGVAAVYT